MNCNKIQNNQMKNNKFNNNNNINKIKIYTQNWKIYYQI